MSAVEEDGKKKKKKKIDTFLHYELSVGVMRSETRYAVQRYNR